MQHRLFSFAASLLRQRLSQQCKTKRILWIAFVLLSVLSIWNIQYLLTNPAVLTVNTNNSSPQLRNDNEESSTSSSRKQTATSLGNNNETISPMTNPNHASRRTHHHHSFWKYPLPYSSSYNHTRAIALLSMGPAAVEATLAERFLVSVRNRGQFDGPILFLTDAPWSRYEYLIKEDMQWILLHPLSQDWNWKLRRDLPYKRFKTYLLEYLKRDDRLRDVEWVYYLDMDVVVGQPLLPWMEHVEQTYMEPTTTTKSHNFMAVFEGNYDLLPLQGGQFVLRKGYSEACLERWRYYMDSNPTQHKDQPSLILMWQGQQQHSTNCTLVKMPQSPYIEFLTIHEMSSLQHGIQPYPTLMHIKNTQHAQLIPDAVQLRFFANLLQLPQGIVQSNITRRQRIRPNRTWSALQMATTTATAKTEDRH